MSKKAECYEDKGNVKMNTTMPSSARSAASFEIPVSFAKDAVAKARLILASLEAWDAELRFLYSVADPTEPQVSRMIDLDCCIQEYCGYLQDAGDLPYVEDSLLQRAA